MTLDTGGIGHTPAASHKWRALLANRAPITMANFTDRLADVYGDRSLFLLDHPLDSPYFSGHVVSYRDLNRLARRAADVLRSLGVRRGDRVALVTSNRIEIAFVEFGAQRLGAVPVPINFMLTADEIRVLVERSGAKVIVTDRTVFEQNIRGRDRIPSLERWVMVTGRQPPDGFASFDALMTEASEDVAPVDLADDEPALIFFTAGTTGLPKGAVLTSGNVMNAFRRYTRIAAVLPTPTRRLGLLVMPLAHTAGHQMLLVLMALATPAIVLGRFDPLRVLDLIEQHRVSMFAGIPTMYRMLLAAGAEERDLSSVRLWGGGADAFPADLVRRFRGLGARGGGLLKREAAFITGYGMAETSGQVSITPPFAVGDACVGWFLPGVRWRLVDGDGRDVPRGEVGELVVRTPGTMREYWGDPHATAEVLDDGWLRTGDLMRRGRLGLMHFVSREKEMIKVGGYSVFPAEVERVLEEHAAVDRCVVVGLPHATKGELPVAAVVRAAGAEVDEADLLIWADEHVAAYRRPRRIAFVDAIPQNFAMKPLRRIVRQQLVDAGLEVEARSDRPQAPAVETA